MVAPIVNVVLTTISMGLIYVISRKIGGVRTAITASILWIVFPSQTIYNMFALSEPLYCTILLLIWIIMIIVHEKIHNISIKITYILDFISGTTCSNEYGTAHCDCSNYSFSHMVIYYQHEAHRQ